jgi:hypothetical protein
MNSRTGVRLKEGQCRARPITALQRYLAIPNRNISIMLAQAIAPQTTPFQQLSEVKFSGFQKNWHDSQEDGAEAGFRTSVTS